MTNKNNDVKKPRQWHQTVEYVISDFLYFAKSQISTSACEIKLVRHKK